MRLLVVRKPQTPPDEALATGDSQVARERRISARVASTAHRARAVHHIDVALADGLINVPVELALRIGNGGTLGDRGAVSGFGSAAGLHAN